MQSIQPPPKNCEVAVVTPYYPPHVGGVEIHAENLVRNLRRFYDVKVISSTPSNADFQVRCLNIPYSPVPFSFPRVKAEIYHSHVPSPFFALRAQDLAESYRSPHVVTYHNDVVIPERVDGFRIPETISSLVESFNEKVVFPLLKKVDLIIATTRSYAETSSVLSKFQEKLEIIPNAVDVEVFRPCEKKENEVVYVGRLVEYKGLGTLIEAMEEVQKYEDVRLVVVGDGEDRRTFEEMCRKRGVNAEFTGRVKRREVVRRISRARVLVLPSFSRLEAFGIVLLEAMACETPVVASNVPGVGEIASKAGFVFSDVKELVSAIVEIVENDALMRKLGRRGRKLVEEKYSWDTVSKRIAKVYERCI